MMDRSWPLVGAELLPSTAGLVTGPTPIERWRNLSARLGTEVWAKRDDLLPLALGGNKVRKLDYILGAAIADDVDTILTQGGAQSNHCRLTAAAAAKFGMKCILYLHGDLGNTTGNLLIDRLLGADIRPVRADDVNGAADQMKSDASGLVRSGRNPRVIPLGGANSLGVASYVLAARELALQCEELNLKPRSIVLPVGTGSTLAGVALGAALYLPGTRVLGVNVAALSSVAQDLPIDELLAESSKRLGIRSMPPLEFSVTDAFAGAGYTHVTSGAQAAILTVARDEGTLLDMTYTAKAMHALMVGVESGTLEGPIVFWHTGGAPELFSRDPRELLPGIDEGSNAG